MSSTPERAPAGVTAEDRLSTIFGDAVRRLFSTYRVVLSAPEAAVAGGPPTLQRIHLLTSHRVPLLVGWTNAAERRAQLHTFGHTLALSRLRLGTELALRPHEYARFLEAATALLEDEGMTVTLVAFVKEGAATGARRPASAWPWAAAAALLDKAQVARVPRGAPRMLQRMEIAKHSPCHSVPLRRCVP